MARHGDERAIEIVGHGLDEPGLAAPGRALQHHRHALSEGGEDLFLDAEGT